MEMEGANYETAEQIKVFLAESEQRLGDFIKLMDPLDIADVLRYLSSVERIEVIQVLPPEMAAEVLSKTDESSKEIILKQLGAEKISQLITQMTTKEAVDLLDDLSEVKKERVLSSLGQEKARAVRQLLQYDSHSAGGIMTPEFLAVKANRTLGDAIKLFKSGFFEHEGENIHYVYVVDQESKLVGLLPIVNLLKHPPEIRIEDVMSRDYPYVAVDQDQEQVASVFRKYDLYALPVVDEDNRLVGRITADSIMDVIVQEANEDLSKAVGVTEDEFTEATILGSVRNRIPWLLIGLTGGLISSGVVSYFEDALHVIMALAFFVPVITAMGGNAGVQSAAIVVRGLATGDMHPKYLFRRVLREIQIAMINGLICASMLGSVVSIWRSDVRLGLIIGLALFCVVIIATFLGTIVPLGLRKLNIDPAIAMGPFVTTSNDILGLLIYLGLATAFIKLIY